MRDRPPPGYSLSLLGKFALSGPDGPVDLSSKKLGALLAYLALTGPAPQPRHKLVSLLWGSHFDVQARQNLRQALSRLRRVLGQDAVISNGDEISLAPGVIDCDAARFEGLVRNGSRASLAEAVDLYKQRLLADLSIAEEAWADWLDGERQRLEGLALDALVRFAGIELSLGHADKTVEAAHRALAINNLREDAHRVMIEALARAGRRAEALRHYQELAALLKRELNTDPDAATKSLVAELRSPQPPARSPMIREPDPSPIGNTEHEVKAESALAVGDEATAQLKVLVVDDHALIREAARTVFKQLKRKTVVFEASSSHETIKIVEKHPDLSLILLDIKLPDRDGFSLLGELRDHYPAIAIIILSASNDQDEVKRAFSLGALGFIPKTTGREVMLNAIELVLSGGIYIPSVVLEREEPIVSPKKQTPDKPG
jgi:DNA-binding SARP family transcriptional activator/ActR/RegA family two-component response regulator